MQAAAEKALDIIIQAVTEGQRRADDIHAFRYAQVSMVRDCRRPPDDDVLWQSGRDDPGLLDALNAARRRVVANLVLERLCGIAGLSLQETQPEGSKMTHVYEGTPDGRQADTAIPVSRFRLRYRPLSDDEKALHDEIKGKAAELEGLFERVKPGRYRSLGMTALEEAVMWTVKELTS